MAELARQTHVPVATGERIFTKWGFREVLEKRAATIVQPDVCYAGGITELRLIAGMAESYYTPLAPHTPQGPCSLAASLQIAARIPNFLAQEGGDHEYLELLAEPLPPVVGGYKLLPTAPVSASPSTRTSSARWGSPTPTASITTPTTARWSTGRDGQVPTWVVESRIFSQKEQE